ncbi:unnamed protein product [Caenorhabditis nigoni]
MVFLLDMPDVPMNLILGNVGPSVIFSLRKVCRSLRDYIDEAKPELYFNDIQILLKYKEITIHLYHHLEMILISYMLHGNGCRIVFDVIGRDTHEKFIENVDYIEGFWNDYSLIMKYQKSNLKRFHLHLSNSADVDDISKFLEQYKNSQTIKTQYLDLGIYQGDEVLVILQHLDANCLKCIRFFNASDKNIDFTEIVKLDQWKNAQEFSIRNLSITAPMKHFTHFSYIDAEFENSDAEDLKALTEAAIGSPKFEKFIIRLHEFSYDNRQRLSELFGSPYTDQNNCTWFFKTCQEENILRIDNFREFSRLNFYLIDRSVVPN